jgi:hypothetical protein
MIIEVFWDEAIEGFDAPRIELAGKFGFVLPIHYYR